MLCFGGPLDGMRVDYDASYIQAPKYLPAKETLSKIIGPEVKTCVCCATYERREIAFQSHPGMMLRSVIVYILCARERPHPHDVWLRATGVAGPMRPWSEA